MAFTFNNSKTMFENRYGCTVVPLEEEDVPPPCLDNEAIWYARVMVPDPRIFLAIFCYDDQRGKFQVRIAVEADHPRAEEIVTTMAHAFPNSTIHR